jgi:hypothetical protein
MFFLKKYNIVKPLNPRDNTPHERTCLICNEPSNVYTTAEEEVPTSSSLTEYVEDSEFIMERSPLIPIEEISCFKSKASYLLAFNMFATIGVGLMYTNNVGAIIHSIADADASLSDLANARVVHVCLLSLMNFGSRGLVGFLADFCNSSIGLPFTFWAILSNFLMGLGFYISTYVIGFLMKGEFFAGSVIC